MSLSNKTLKSFQLPDLDNVYNIPEIADEYTSKKYDVGDYVNYQGVIYRCTTQISVAESWNGSHWTAVKIANDLRDNKNELTDLKSAFDDISDVEKIPETFELIANSYVDGNGNFQTYNNWSRTDYIEVTPGQTITITAPEKSEYNCSYDANKSLVGGKWTALAGTHDKTLGSNVKYIVLSGKTASMQNTVLYLSERHILDSDLSLSETMTEEVESMIKFSTQPDQIINPTAYLMKQQIPDYYFDRNETAQTKHDIGYLDDKINSVPDGYHFMFVTDTHWNDNAQQSTKLISYVKDRIGAKFVLFGGDILTAYSTEAIAYRWLCDFVSDYKNAFGSNFLPVVGNHDLNNAGTGNPPLMYSDLVPLFMRGCDGRFHYCDFYDDRIDAMQSAKGMTDAEVSAMKQYFRTCYYVDDIDGKVRYIIYNTGAGDGGSGITQYIDTYITGSYEELLIVEWLYDVFMNTPEGYNVILCTHIPGDFSWEYGGGTILSSIRKKFAAVVGGLKAKKYITVYLPNSISDYTWWGGSDTMIFDFRNAPTVGIVAVMGGHAHVDTFGKYGFIDNNYTSTSVSDGLQGDINGVSYTVYQSATELEPGVHTAYEVPIILSQHDAYTMNSGPHSHAMTLDTVTEQVIDVVTLTPDGNIALTRIGAGNDRYLTIL